MGRIRVSGLRILPPKRADPKGQRTGTWVYLSYILNSFKGFNVGDYIGDYSTVVEEDTRSFDYSSFSLHWKIC